MIKNIFARINSLIVGKKIGEVRYRKALPFIIGGIHLLLPSECLTEKEKELTKYRIHKDIWNGFDWKFVETLEITKKELKRRFDNKEL